MGGTDLGVSLSASASATSGLQGNFSRIFGDKYVGGLGVPKWVLPMTIVAAFLLAIVWVLRR